MLYEHTPGLEVRAFGSRVSWNARETSDLDLALLTDQPLSIARMAALRATFTASDLSFRVDLVDWASISESFRKVIEKDSAVLCPVQTPNERGQKNNGQWQEVRWGDLATLEYGRALRGHDTARGPFRVFGTNGPIGWHDEALCPRPSVVVGRKGAYRGIHYSAEPFFVIDTAFYLKPKVEMDVQWAYYELLTRDINGMDSGSAIPSTNREAFYSLPVSVPPFPEQRAIAHILGTLDDKIELNRRMNETLEALARALFTSWFVDFDPVRAKMEGRDTGLPEDIADLFPNRLVESELGEIPEGWRLRPLDSVARFQNGLALQKFRPAENETRLPVVKIAQLRAGETNSGEWASSTIKPGCIIENGDVVFSWSGSLLVQMWCGGRAALNQHLFKVTSEEYPKWFYLHSVLSHFPEFQQTAKDKATTMGHIRRHHLTDALCVVPPDGVIARVSEMFGGLLERQVANEVAGRALVTLRNTLLPKLVSGELRVNVLEAAVGRDDRPVSVDAREA